MLAVVGILLVLGGFSVANLMPAIRNSRVEAALQTLHMQTRRARQLAIDERRVYILSLNAPGTIQIQRVELDGTVTAISQVDLPADINFQAEPGIPTSPAETPDGFGTGAYAVDFNGSNQAFFQADGSAEDALGRIVNGVVYIARPGEVTSSRAITIFGTTGRLKSWKLAERADDTYYWR
ncbi:MAG TPA: hypothetical protein VH744_03605 [Terriglobales bacterium]|jgi:Tfp pilus assembly protein FimT